MSDEPADVGAASEHHLTVPHTARYYALGGEDLASPTGSAGDAPAGETWFVLHGYRQLARRFIRRFEELAAPGRRVVAPEGRSRFYLGREQGRHGPEALVGASWMTREDRLHEIDDYVTYLDLLADAVGSAATDVTVLGFSQGAATAARWAALGTARPRRVVLWGGYFPPDLDMGRAASALAGVDLVLVRGREDGGLTPELTEREASLLADADIHHRVVAYDGGHEIDPATLATLAS